MTKTKASEIIGQRFNRLVAVSQGRTRNGRRYFLCRCDCGNIKEIGFDSLRRGTTKSCGCLLKEHAIRMNVDRYSSLSFRGNKKLHPLFVTWLDIRRRCTKPWMHNYKYYGAKGVTICEAWANDFWAFADYVGEPPTDGHTIDRIDTYGNYEPGNIRWATHKEQAANKRKKQLTPAE